MTCKMPTPASLETVSYANTDVETESQATSPQDELAAYLRCPACGGERLARTEDSGPTLECQSCGTQYPWRDGILDLVTADWAAGVDSRLVDEARYWEEEEHIYRAWNHPVALGFAQQRAAYVRETLPLDEVHSAVDVGAGNGMSTHCLEDDIETVISVDLSRRLLAGSPARHRVRADAQGLPLKDKSVDVAYAWELLHHVEQPRRILADMKRVAREYVFFFEPNRWNPAQTVFALVHKPDRACLKNTRAYLAREIEAAGLEIIRHETVGWFTPNVPPLWLYQVLRHLPFRVPIVGLSHFFALRAKK